jgi:hypothetical protein
MKSLKWYQHLWERKLNEQTHKGEPEQGWLAIKDLLDHRMPVAPESEVPLDSSVAAKSIAAKLATWLSYILPAAAMIYGAVYLINIDRTKESKNVKTKNRSEHRFGIGNSAMDSLKNGNEGSKGGYDSLKIKDDSLKIKDNSVKLVDYGFKAIDYYSKAKKINKTKQAKDAKKSTVSTAAAYVTNRPVLTSIHIVSKDIYVQNSVPLLSGRIVQNRRFEYLDTSSLMPLPIFRSFKKNNSLNLNSKVFSVKRIKPIPAIKVTRRKTKGKHQNLKDEIDVSSNSYGIGVGGNINKNTTFYIGAFGTKKISKRISATAAVLMHSAKSFKGRYNHASYFRPDSNPAFTFSDSRKLKVLEIPLTINYLVTKRIRVSVGPVISFPIKQSGVKLGPITLPRDTIFHGKEVSSIIQTTRSNKMNYGFKAGIGIEIKAIEMSLHYQKLTPYEFKNSLGINRFSNSTLQLGISYKFGTKP